MPPYHLPVVAGEVVFEELLSGAAQAHSAVVAMWVFSEMLAVESEILSLALGYGWWKTENSSGSGQIEVGI
jgi:hypothetical protein